MDQARIDEQIQEAERVRRHQEQTLHAIYDMLDAAHWSWNIHPDGSTSGMWWNDRVAAMFGFDSSELEVNVETWLSRLVPEDAERVLACSHEFNTNGDPDATYDIEYRMLHRNGEHVWVHALGRKLTDENGNITEAVGIFRDITDKKRMERQQRVINALSDEYASVYAINLKTLTIVPYKTSDRVQKRLADMLRESAYEAAIEHYISARVLEQDRDLMHQYTDTAYIREQLETANSFSRLYLNIDDEYCRLTVVKTGTDTIVAGFSVDDASIRHELEQQERRDADRNLISSLALIYTHVCFVDMETGTYEAPRMSERITRAFGEKYATGDFSSILDMYRNRFVHPDDRRQFDRIATMDACRALFANGQTHSFEFRIITADGIRHRECQLVMPSTERHEFTFAVRDIDEEFEERERVRQELYEDSLTKVENRRFLDEQLLGAPCSAVAMADIDLFKEINDSMGHQCGDEALAAAAKVLKSCVRATDNIVRYGGDEFLIMFPDIPYEAFQEKLETMRKNAEQICLVGYPDVHFTMSFGGVHKLAAVMENIPGADRMLYEAKKQRNAVVTEKL